MRKKNHENFIAKLMMTKDIIDAAELEKHIRNVVGKAIPRNLKSLCSPSCHCTVRR